MVSPVSTGGSCRDHSYCSLFPSAEVTVAEEHDGKSVDGDAIRYYYENVDQHADESSELSDDSNGLD